MDGACIVIGMISFGIVELRSVVPLGWSVDFRTWNPKRRIMMEKYVGSMWKVEEEVEVRKV